MSIGPILECPEALASKIPALASSVGVRVEVLDELKLGEWNVRYVFKTRFGRILGRRKSANGLSRLWLTFPREHAFNPVFWFSDFRLLNRVKHVLLDHGAQSCDWSF
jgi:hypothetical protein